MHATLTSKGQITVDNMLILIPQTSLGSLRSIAASANTDDYRD